MAFDLQRGEPARPERLEQILEDNDYARYTVSPQPIQYPLGSAAEADLPSWEDFHQRYEGQWRLEVDQRTQLPLLIEGSGVPWVPGNGNDLDQPAFGPNQPALDRERSGVREMNEVAKAFLDQERGLLQVSPADLVFDEKASVGFGRANRYWTLRYQFVYRDPELGVIPVRGAHLFFRVNHGNLVQFGNQQATVPQDIDTQNMISQQEAIDRALELIYGPALGAEARDVEVKGAARDLGQADRTLQIVPLNDGNGNLGHQLVRAVWVVTPKFSYELWLNARNGELLFAVDRALTADAAVKGGIYPTTNTDPELILGLPFLDVNNDGIIKPTNVAGIYDYSPPGTLAACSLEGDYIEVIDTCGASALATSQVPGDISYGAGAGTDCDTPGYGGPGNTHAARSSFFHLNHIKEKARAYLNVPVITTPWLDNQLDARVNRDNACGWTCNACWNGSNLQFVHSDTCGPITVSNLGEISAIFLHEFGHGLDQNTNGAPPEKASGEAYGDIMGFLQTHDPCIGHNSFPGVPCIYGCDATCTGVRKMDVTPAISPATIDVAPADCDRWTCPYAGYMGPMGYEGHCEGLIAAGAVWDMAQAFVARYGDGAGWALADRIWYESLYSTGSAYQLVSGGQCNPSAVVDGCGADNWYTIFLGIDDDNGDLSDGTPNADLIWNAFNDHGIACDTEPPVSSICPSIDAPALTAVAGIGEVNLTWTPETDAADYRIYRNPFGCDSGFTPIAEVADPTVAYVDSAVTNGTTYYYAVQAIGVDDACVSPFSNCEIAAPTAPLIPADIVIVLDESGSMSGTTDLLGESKMDALHDAGLLVVDLVEDYASDGFTLGATSFSTAITGTEALKDLSVPAEKTALENFINALIPTDLTAIGLGIQEALTLFPDPSPNRKAVMLLSDGMQNIPPFLELQAPPPGVAIGGADLPADVSFSAVALGTHINDTLFDELTTQGGIPGFFYGGGTAELQANFMYWAAFVLGLDPASAFPLVPPSNSDSSRLFVPPPPTTLVVNRTVRRATFVVTWPAKGHDLRFYLLTPFGLLHPPASAFHPDRGYAAHTVGFPIPGRGPMDHVGDWTIVVTDADGGAPTVPYEQHALFDDPAITLAYNAGGDDPGAGETLPLRVEVLENGHPLSGLTVTAAIAAPKHSLGETLSATAVTPAQLQAVQPGGGDALPSAASRKLEVLKEIHPELLERLAPRDFNLVEIYPGTYEATVPASRTSAAGRYDFDFRVNGVGIYNQAFRRTQRFARHLRVKPILEKTTVWLRRWESPQDGRIAHQVIVTPRDGLGMRLGPGHGHMIQLDAQTSGIHDNLDGSYTVTLVSPPSGDLRVTIGEAVVADCQVRSSNEQNANIAASAGSICVPVTAQVDPTVRLGRDPTLGERVEINARVRIGNEVVVGNDVRIQANAFIADNVRMQDGVVIAPHARIGTGVELGAGVVVHSHAQIGDNVRIGPGSTVGTWSVVEDGVIVGQRVEIFDFANIGQGCVLEDDVYVGTSQLGPQCHLGANSYVGQRNHIEARFDLGEGAAIANSGAVEEGVRIGAHRVVWDRVWLGREVNIDGVHPDARLTHTIGYDVQIGHGGHIGSHTWLADDVTLGDDAKVGEGVYVWPRAEIGQHVQLGQGCAVGAVVIGDRNEIGADCQLWQGTRIGHDNQMGDRVILRERCTVGDGNQMGQNVVLRRGVSVGDELVLPDGFTAPPGATLGL